MGTLKDFKSRYYFCPSNWATPFRLWFYNSPTFFLDMDCWLEHMTLHLNASTYTSSTPPGIDNSRSRKRFHTSLFKSVKGCLLIWWIMEDRTFLV